MTDGEGSVQDASDTTLEYREDTSRYLEQLDAQIRDAEAHIEMLKTLRSATNFALAAVATEAATGSSTMEPEIQTALMRGEACAVRTGPPSTKWDLEPSAFGYDWVRMKLIEPDSPYSKLELGPMGWVQRDRSPPRAP